MPLIGQVDLLTRSTITGWAADTSRPDLSIGIHCTVNGRRMGRSAGDMRDDLTGIFPGATGRYGFRLTDGLLPLSPFIDNDVAITFVRTGGPLQGGTITLPALAAAADGDGTDLLRPVVVTATGRSGTSLLMARLATHPDILVAREHPYELKLLSYYAKALSVLTAEADRQNSTDPDTMLTKASQYSLGFNPYNETFDRDDPEMRLFWEATAPRELRTCFARIVDAHYRVVAQQTAKPHAAIFVEKIGTSEMVRQAVSFMFGKVSEILLVRDPRDIICSSKFFWKHEFADSVRSLRNQLIVASHHRTDPHLSQYVLKYEDLLSQPQAAMAGVFAFLGVDSTSFRVDAQTEQRIFELHGTTASPEETIGRWRRELSQDQVDIANRELQQVLESYGYKQV
jgi:hypothetical protein